MGGPTPNIYETDKLVSEYLLFHYGKPEEIMPWNPALHDALDFAVRTVAQCVDLKRLRPGACALDLGCAVGRSSFELARFCTEVVGIDYSHRFVEAAAALKKDGALSFRHAVEGELTVESTAVVPPEIDRRRVHFEQGDATRLREGLPHFDFIHMANLIDRLRDPAACLAQLHRLANPGAQLVITSPYTWLEEFTPRGNWIGGREKDGKPVRTLDGLRELLQGRFLLIKRLDLPFLIREHSRKFQWSVAEATVWLKTE
jgi:putative 4-mercaptohistidine N1-methyltranferase